MDAPLRSHSINELRYYLTVTPCPACGKGPRAVVGEPESPQGGRAATLVVRCDNCLVEAPLVCVCDHAVPAEGPEAETINPSPEPSRLVDLGQWLSLFYMLVESAAAETAKSEIRRDGFRAALCLAEALKFYGDDELPPASAFFHPASAEVFRAHPEKFARQRLRDMQSKLPTLPAMAKRIARDEKPKRRKWWRFWQ